MLTGRVRFLFSIVMLLAFVWFAVTVPLGKRTLWGHVNAIFGTQEAKDLAEGTREEAEKMARKVKAELHQPDMARGETTPQASAPQSPTAQPRHVKAPLPTR